MYLHKTERIKKNVPSGGYIISAPLSKDIFVPSVETA